ncbi:efflux RND transporter permease subunit [Bradymonas sediminis]|uniref:CusA/CzcA family heavy metal efflux RND transporter n=1 Tax=Bradymonas sediminis TaxID=1548548 RepID=A0A2Z4FID6_9DELT|nr:efflux RND transporter permease subunit [Bradymonas sediminis]AWV88669.1 CusA/CzcA family heavy metal efflux RND transporter [Bradymonas sediminis]TDP63645.1 CzcA family heavy metal efflux pump [Bradymonas sediminis]
MIDGIIKWSLENRFFVVLAAAALFIWGTWQAVHMPVDVFPNLTAPSVTVVVEAHGKAPEEVESQITYPIETALNGATGVRRVRSTSGIGNAVIWVEFDWGTDVYRARQIVGEKLQLVRSQLPADVDPPVMGPISSVMGEIMFVALTSEKHTPIEVRSEADWVLRRRLLAVAGVSQVMPIGGGVKQYQVHVNPAKLAAYNLGLNEVTDALTETNENVSAGFYRENGREYLIYGLGRIERISDIGNTVLAVRNGQPLTVADLGEVKIAPALKRGDGSFNGKDAVIIGIQKQPDANTLALTERLDEALDGIEASLPEGMELQRNIFRQSNFIEISIDNVMTALRDGAILVVLILLLFLANIRATVITATAIPLSLLVAVVVLDFFGGSINTMTLGGMAIAVGALVDDAIVDVENVVRRLRLDAQKPPELRQPTIQVIFEASKEVRSSIVFATLIIILVFLPLFFLSGVEGRLLQPLGIAYVVSLSASLVVALTVTPAMCYFLLPGTKAIMHNEESWAMRWLKRGYEPVLDKTLPHWKLITAASLTALGIAGWGLLNAGQAFLPEFNEGTLTVSAVTLPGTSLETSGKLGKRIEEIMLAHPEVVSTSRRTGRAELDEHAQGVNAAEIDVDLKMHERSQDEFLAALRQDLAQLPGMNITIGQPISHRIDHMLSGTRANIAVKIFGSDLYELRRLGQEVSEAMENVEGVVDLNVEQQMDIPFLLIDFDRDAIARHGLRVREVAEVIETAFVGHDVSRIIEEQRGFDLLVRYPEDAKANLESIRQTLIKTPTGAQVPLHALADVRRDRRPNRISRESVQRNIVVSCNVAGGDLVGVVEKIRSRVGEQVVMPTGYHVEYGGQFESATQASQTLTLLTGVVIIGIFLLLFVSLGSGRDALLVMANLPHALIGGVVGVYVLDGILSVASLIGFITLFGIATRNGLLMVSHIRHLHYEEGVSDRWQAVKQGAMERLAPILMTALASGLGLVPLALQAGEPGSEIQAPMAIVLLFGLISATALNMIVVPALYLRFGEITAAKS